MLPVGPSTVIVVFLTTGYTVGCSIRYAATQYLRETNGLSLILQTRLLNFK